MKVKNYILLITALLFGTVILSAQNSKAEGIKVSGIIVSAESGDPLAGASILLDGSKPVMTGDDGTFSVSSDSISKGARILTVKVPGYAVKKMFITKSGELKIEMNEPGFSGINKEYISEFGRESSLFSSYSIGTVSPDQGNSTAATSDGLLQGTVTGLNTVFRSGQPGSGSEMWLQGFNSLKGTTQPLILVDGFPYENSGSKTLISNYQENPLSDIDIKDIEDITVLKDGTGLYGAKGANGVILINTIKADDATTTIDVDVHSGMSFKPDLFPVMDANDYRIYLTDLLQTSGLSSGEIQELPYINQEKPVPDEYGRISGNEEYYMYNHNTKWQDEVYNTSFDEGAYLKIKGGDETALYAISLGFLNKEGILSNTNYLRFNARFNADIKVSEKLMAHSRMSFTRGKRELQNEGPSSFSNLLTTSLLKAPITSVYEYDALGNPSPNIANEDVFGVSNVNAISEKKDMILDNKNYRFMGSLSLDYVFNDNFKISGLTGLNFSKYRDVIFIPEKGIGHDTLPNAIVRNEAKHRVESLFVLYSNLYGTYNKKFSYSTKLVSHLGVRIKSSDLDASYAYGYNSPSDKFKAVSNGDPNLGDADGESWKENWFSAYGDVNMYFLNKYLLSCILSEDVSSRYDGGSFHPTFSAGWLLSSEPFINNIKAIDFLKLRASFGISGNDDIGNYSNKVYYIATSFLRDKGLVSGGIPNKDIKPETMRKVNIGLDGTFFKQRLSLSANLFFNTVDDMVTLSDAPSYTGEKTYLDNGGKMTNNGWEIGVTDRILDGKVKWDLGINISSYKNEVKRLDCGTFETKINGATVQTKVGQPIGVFYGYKTDGVYSSQDEAETDGLYIMDGAVKKSFAGGDMKFQNTDNSSKEINEDDRTKIGDPTPDFFGSVFNRVSYKGVTLTAKINYSVGGDVYNYTRYMLESMSGYGNQATSVLNRWNPHNGNTDIPKASFGDPMGNSRFSDRWIEDGSYIRLKEITLSYNLPHIADFLRSAQVYITGENLITLTDYMGADPEFSQSSNPLYYGVDATICPQPKAVFVGIKLGL